VEPEGSGRAAQLRIEYPGAIYHVLSRGDRREDIFHDDVDRQDFLKTLAEAFQKTGFQIHAYGLIAGELRRESAEARAERIMGEEPGRLGWTPEQLGQRRKHDPDKLRIALRLRRETILTVGWIAQRLCLGTRKSASTRLQEVKRSGPTRLIGS
jgi:hypothetical protein